jgi:hypothetical protein
MVLKIFLGGFFCSSWNGCFLLWSSLLLFVSSSNFYDDCYWTLGDKYSGSTNRSTQCFESESILQSTWLDSSKQIVN